MYLTHHCQWHHPLVQRQPQQGLVHTADVGLCLQRSYTWLYSLPEPPEKIKLKIQSPKKRISQAGSQPTARATVSLYADYYGIGGRTVSQWWPIGSGLPLATRLLGNLTRSYFSCVIHWWASQTLHKNPVVKQASALVQSAVKGTGYFADTLS